MFNLLDNFDDKSSLRESGQILLILAFAMLGLLVAAGLAVDSGVLYVRKAQLDRAVDAAALSGVVARFGGDSVPTANNHGVQFMAANGVILSGDVSKMQAGNCADITWATDNLEYCGESSEATDGRISYAVTAQWCAEIYFMQLVGFGQDCVTSSGGPGIPLISSSEAELAVPFLLSIVGSSNGAMDVPTTLSMMGGSACGSDLNLFNGEATENPGSSSSLVGALGGTLQYQIKIPKTYQDRYNTVRVELFDPDSHNAFNYNFAGPSKDQWTIWNRYGQMVSNPLGDQGSNDDIGPGCYLDGGTEAKSWWDACTLTTDEVPEANSFWFIRSDEIRGPDDGCHTGSMNYTTADTNTSETTFRLFYYKAGADGTPEEVEIATYISGQLGTVKGKATDLQWVSPTTVPGERMPPIDAVLDTPSDYGLEGVLGGNEDTVGGDGWYYLPDDLSEAAGYAPANATRCTDNFPVPGAAFPALSGVTFNGTRCVLSNIPFTDDLGVDNFDGTGRATQYNVPSTVGGEPVTLPETCGGCDTSNGDFIVYLDSELKDIFGEGGDISIYLEISSTADASDENGFNVWVGPQWNDDGHTDGLDHIVPSQVNSRNMFLYNLFEIDSGVYKDWHGAHGLEIAGKGAAIYNGDGSGTTHIPMTYVTPEMAGQTITLGLRDAENGPGVGSGGSTNETWGPIYFHFDTVPVADWAVCYEDNDSVTWPHGTVDTITDEPGDPGGWRCQQAPFQGGSLIVDGTGSPAINPEPDIIDLSMFLVSDADDGDPLTDPPYNKAYFDLSGLFFDNDTKIPLSRKDGIFITYTFTIPSKVGYPAANDFFRGGTLYATFWAGWNETYALYVDVEGEGSPVLTK